MDGDLLNFTSIDAGTSGPLNAAIMYIPNLIGLDINLITGRIMAFIILTASIYTFYRILKEIDSKFAFYELMLILIYFGNPSLSYNTSYTSEFMPTLLILIMILLYFKSKINHSIILTILAGLIFPLIILSKLQAAPIGMTIWFFLLLNNYKFSIKLVIIQIITTLFMFLIFLLIYFKSNNLGIILLVLTSLVIATSTGFPVFFGNKVFVICCIIINFSLLYTFLFFLIIIIVI
jgi:hypothetical protein